jgi:starch synthase
MDAIFRRRRDVLSGIMNGIDVEEYTPDTDPLIVANYTAEDTSNKAKCKQALQQELGLAQDPDVPIVIMIGRLTQQKGMDLVQWVLGSMMSQPMQLVVLGTGDWEYEQMLKSCADYYPDRMCAITRFDEALSHRMYAGADILLMPSLFEPCGLSQMIAMHYGTLPVVRETGGLKDSVIPYNEYTGEGTGFSFANYNAHEMLYTLERAIWVYQNNKEAWAQLMRQAMAEDFSWRRAAKEYIKLYERLQPQPEEPEEAAQAPVEESAETPVEEAVEAPVEETVETPAEAPAEEAVEAPAEEPEKAPAKEPEKAVAEDVQTEQPEEPAAESAQSETEPVKKKQGRSKKNTTKGDTKNKRGRKKK